ncbi:MAG: peptide deformylase [Firmicutes bacterium]|nr:peptide deformylase [Bacillota bacterium]
MALRKIRLDGDPVLKKKTARVTKFSPHLHRLLEDMVETMIANEGAGLAAPQVGISKSIIVLRDEDKILEVINPEIVSSSGEIIDLEGCLSLPGIYGEVARFERVGVHGFDRLGKKIKFNVAGFLARVFQHEIDHLRGILFVSRARRLLTPEEVKQISGKDGPAE